MNLKLATRLAYLKYSFIVITITTIAIIILFNYYHDYLNIKTLLLFYIWVGFEPIFDCYLNYWLNYYLYGNYLIEFHLN